MAFLATLTYGAVPVPLLHEFKSANIHHLVNHSEAKILFVDDVIWEGLTESEMPDLQAIIQVNTFKLLYSADEKITAAREHLNELFGRKYPNAFTPDALDYYEDSAEELAIINYTSGTSGFSKGVDRPEAGTAQEGACFNAAGIRTDTAVKGIHVVSDSKGKRIKVLTK